MKYLSASLIWFLLVFIWHIFAFTPSDSLISFLDSKSDMYEQRIQEQWEEVRVKLLWALDQIIKLAPSKDFRWIQEDRFTFIIWYLRDSMQKEEAIKVLTREDFAETYEWFEIVDYPETIVATVVNNWPLGQTNDDSFDNLADYIFWNNSGRQEIAMTSPVTRTQVNESTYETAFIMPSWWTVDSLPSPNNDRITIKTIPWSLKAVKRFSWRVNKEKVDNERAAFQEDLIAQWINRYWLPTLSQYDWPRVSASNRRNELWVELNENQM